MDKPLDNFEKDFLDYKESKNKKIKNLKNHLANNKLCCSRKRAVKNKISHLENDKDLTLGGCWSNNSFGGKYTLLTWFDEEDREAQFDYIIKRKFKKENCEYFTEDDREDFIEKGIYHCCRDYKQLSKRVKKL